MTASAAFQALTAQSVQQALSTKAFGRTLHLLEGTSSTNTVAMTLGQEGASHGTVVVAETQTAGRGRSGRQWYSPAGKNLYCSVVLRSMPSPDQLTLWLSWIPLIAGLATARAVQTSAALQPSVKWPNDILVGTRKLGGTLCESTGLGSAHPFVVVGIGLNVNLLEHEFPDDLRELATSMAIEADRPFDRAAVLAALLLELETRCDAFLAGQHRDLMNEYVLRCSTVGRQVCIDLAHGERVEGYADSISPDGSLRVVQGGRSSRPGGGSTVNVRAGDVTHVR
jgi:BirA family biotin operon repressor/biotin-[acetyl-CoA-carboxylase] ligase